MLFGKCAVIGKHICGKGGVDDGEYDNGYH
jgi:hypothetical protein